MKAQELRIGNIVNFAEDGVIFVVEKIEFNGLSVSNKKETTWIELYEFEGVPLTEEWLLKFGFINNFDDFEYCFDNARIAFSNEDFYTPKGFVNKQVIKIGLRDFATVEMNLEHIKYAHQLQNLYFALTGEELKIEKL